MRLLKNLMNYNERLGTFESGDRLYRTNQRFRPSVVVIPSFGAGLGDDSYNATLARTLIASRELFGNLPVIAQSEVCSFLNGSEEGNFYSIGESYCSGESSRLISKISTKDILKSSRRIIAEKGLNPRKVLYISHPAHLLRIMSLGNRMGLGGFPFITNDVEWPTEDQQPWVRSKAKWAVREILARIHDGIF